VFRKRPLKLPEERKNSANVKTRNAKASARQQCVYEGVQRRNLRQINASNIILKRTGLSSSICYCI